MLRLAFDFIITWRETRTRPNAYDGNVIITGGSISGWTPGNEEEDIVINGEEINPQTNNML